MTPTKFSIRGSHTLCLLLCVSAVGVSQPALGDVVSFDGLVSGDFCVEMPLTFHDEGFVFATPERPGSIGQRPALICPAGRSGWDTRYAANGTGTLLKSTFLDGWPVPLTMTREDGHLFNLTSVDIAECFKQGDFAYGANAGAIRLTGVKSQGGKVVLTLPLDGLIDGPGGIADFESHALSEFTRLRSVSFLGIPSPGGFGERSANFSIDNLVVSAVPNPPTWLLATVGLGVLIPVVRGSQRLHR